MFSALRSYSGLALAYTRHNFAAQLEYRGAFVWEVVAMFVNDCVWLAFWYLFFTRFPVLRGWELVDVVTLWALAAAAYGLAHGIFGNTLHLANLIAQGQLDAWMLYPRALLPHLLLGRMSATSWGDALFGFTVFICFAQPDASRLAMFVLLTISGAAVFVGFGVLASSLAFFLGNATTLAEQWRFAMITFSTYPGTLFQGGVKFVLFTLIPAGFVTYLPVDAIRERSLGLALLSLAGAATILAAGALVFHLGLRRYESGNLTAMRE
jgi:ABC-2 type transport system permease protein